MTKLEETVSNHCWLRYVDNEGITNRNYIVNQINGVEISTDILLTPAEVDKLVDRLILAHNNALVDIFNNLQTKKQIPLIEEVPRKTSPYA